MKYAFKYILLFWLSLLLSLNADTLVLKDGNVLQGMYKGGTEMVIKFESDGVIKEIAVSDVTSLTITTRPAKLQAAPVSPTATAAEVSSIPAGTKIMIRTTEAISTASHQKGTKFTAQLEHDLTINGKVIAPKGNTVYGTVLESIGGRRVGKQLIMVTFDQLVINGQPVPIKTDNVGAEGGAGGAARAVGAGALIGAAAGDAGKGAAVGAGLALLAGGRHIQVPPNTLVEVSIKENVNLAQ